MILQVNKLFFPDIGGVETVVKQYTDFLKHYEEVTVLCIKKNFSLKTSVEDIDGVKVIRCASFGTFLSLPLSIVFFFNFFKYAKKARIIHIHEPFPLGTIAGLFFGRDKKIFLTWHSDIIRQKLFKKVMEFFQKRLCRKAELIISTSDSLISFSNILKLYKEKVITIPLCLDEKNYTLQQNNFPDELKNLPEQFAFYFGRLVYYKGIDVLINSMEYIDKNIPVVIAGSGELEYMIKSKTKEYKNLIFINRYLSEDEKKFLLSRCKFFIFPSNYPSEAFGIVQLEAMVYKKPVINTYLPTGVPWVSLNNISGLTVDPNDPIQLANAINTLFKDNHLYQRLSDGAYKRFLQYFSCRKVNQKLYKLYFEDFCHEQ